MGGVSAVKISRLRQVTPVAGARIIGFGAYQPSTVITSEETAKRFGRTGEWVRGRTGIVSLRKASAAETVQEMAIAAGQQALANSGVEGSRIGLVIVASCSAESPIPDAASEVAHRIGARMAGAFDLNAACAGFCYALTVAADVVRNGSAEYVLVVGTERMTAWVDPADLGTSILFGDGAGAAVVGPSAQPGIGPVVWGSDGQGADLIRIPDFTRGMHMEGQAVFRWATMEVHPIALAACERAGVKPGDLAAIVPHQANLRIIHAMAKKIGAPGAVVAQDVVQSGNTSAASIPLALQRLIEAKAIERDSLALLIGFGAGLSYAAQVVTLP
ncbi:3-oxoacyl-[acyl-carrier-protein] synthase-3 [Kibdelosporangium aridum]|uniref:3-oxoacyl-[acyl-carrier-protein] synthase-3 n=1 Tax=Kibdelosporangium aridum TaxID=2030 RepID=A0A1W1ZYV9_KIBAR|nr:3-oxoacyl-[acyl-carrier-protein] synthase-3 [Kibdelosporangium aridum]